jgi:hypothetical protein
MDLKLKSVIKTFLYLSLIFWVLSSGNQLATAVSKEGNLKTSVSTQTAPPEKNKKDSPQVHADKNETQTPKETALDKAGQRIGQRIDKFSDTASSKLGKWIDTEIFLGITWL